MKNLFIAIALIITSVTNAQEFAGIKIDGDLTSFVNALKSKGYTFKRTVDNGCIMTGKIGFKEVDVFIFTTPKSKKVFKLTIYFQEKTSWSSLKSEYLELAATLTEKYGQPSSSYDTFDKPYYEGDGYEMTDVQLDKCNYSTYWMNKSNLTLAIEISKYKQVKLIYENDKNMDLKEQEIKNMQNSVL